MTEKRRAPIEVLERLAEAAIKLDHLLSTTGHFGASERLALNNAAAAYRAAVAPLRTRAVVDAEIAATVRKDRCGAARGIGCAQSTLIALDRLCREPTSAEAPQPFVLHVHASNDTWPVIPCKNEKHRTVSTTEQADALRGMQPSRVIVHKSGDIRQELRNYLRFQVLEPMGVKIEVRQ